MADRDRKLPMPRYIEPMRATLVREAFDDPDWLFETKWDGFRVEALVGRGVADLWTRGHQDASRYFGRFLDPATWIAARSAIVDGEVVAFDPHGDPDFALLQQRIRQRADPSGDHPVVYAAAPGEKVILSGGRRLVGEIVAAGGERNAGGIEDQVLGPLPHLGGDRRGREIMGKAR
jgi:hypothetical protein